MSGSLYDKEVDMKMKVKVSSSLGLTFKVM